MHVRHVDDSELADGDEGEDDDVTGHEAIEIQDSDDEKESSAPVPKKKSGPVLKAFRDLPASSSSTQPPATTSRRAQAENFMSKISASLDPSLRDAREDARFTRRALQDESARLVQENRDLQARVQALNDRVTQLLTENIRFQSRIELLETLGAMRGPAERVPARSRFNGWEFEEPQYRPQHAFPPASFYPSHFSPGPVPSTPRMPSSTPHYRSHTHYPSSWSTGPPSPPAWDHPMDSPVYAAGDATPSRRRRRGLGYRSGTQDEEMMGDQDIGTSVFMAGPSTRPVPSSSAAVGSSSAGAAGPSSSGVGSLASDTVVSSSSSSTAAAAESASITLTITTPSRHDRHLRRHPSSSSLDGEQL